MNIFLYWRVRLASDVGILVLIIKGDLQSIPVRKGIMTAVTIATEAEYDEIKAAFGRIFSRRSFLYAMPGFPHKRRNINMRVQWKVCI